jgi:hypothetical protein
MKLGKWYYSSNVYAFPFFFHSKNGVGAFRFISGKIKSLEFAPLLKSIIDEEYEQAEHNKELEEASRLIVRTIFSSEENWRFDMGYMRQLQRKE